MNFKINIQNRLKRHYRNTSFLQKRSIISALKKFKIFSVLIILILPIYPTFWDFWIEKEIAVWNYDESTIIMAYNWENSKQDEKLFSQDSWFIKPETIIDNNRDISGINNVIYYTIQYWDSFSTIADMFNVSINSILWANDFNKDRILKTWEVIKIPPVTWVVYIVLDWDTIDSIAKKFKVNSSSIYDQNKLTSTTKLIKWQQLIIPWASKIIPPVIIKKANPKKAVINKKTKLKSWYAVKYTWNSKWFAWWNCTYFVANNKNVTWRWNANQWLNNAKAQWVPTWNDPAVWAIVSFKWAWYNPYYWHVWIVVDMDWNDIIVKDMNYRYINEITIRRVNKNDNTIKWYIYVD